MTDVKTSKAEAKSEDNQARPATGLFGFAGSTLFQPGQPLFQPESGVAPYKPKAADDKADRGQ